MATIPSPLEDTARDEVAARLQPVLVDLIDLSLAAKQLHWTVVGQNFSALHEQLDTVTAAYRMWADEVAERMTAAGIAPDGRPGRVAADTEAPTVAEGWVGERAVVEDMTARLAGVIARSRARFDGLGKHDPVSEDVLLGIIGGLEQQHWMFAAQLAKP